MINLVQIIAKLMHPASLGTKIFPKNVIILLTYEYWRYVCSAKTKSSPILQT